MGGLSLSLHAVLRALPDWERVEIEIKGEVGTKAGYAKDIRTEFEDMHGLVEAMYSGYDPEVKDSYIYLEVRTFKKG